MSQLANHPFCDQTGHSRQDMYHFPGNGLMQSSNNHYPSKSWPSTTWPYSVTRPQWIEYFFYKHIANHYSGNGKHWSDYKIMQCNPIIIAKTEIGYYDLKPPKLLVIMKTSAPINVIIPCQHLQNTSYQNVLQTIHGIVTVFLLHNDIEGNRIDIILYSCVKMHG